MNAQMKVFFDALSDGVAIANSDGVVDYVNEPGQIVFAAKVGQPFPDPRVVKGVRDLAAGFGKAPLSIPLPTQMGSPAGCIAQLMPLPVANQYAIVTRVLAEKQFYEMTLKNFYEFIRIDLARPIKQFSEQLDFFVEEESSEETHSLVENGRVISERLQRIEMLAELFGSSPLVDQERLMFDAMISNALNAESQQLSARGLEVFLDGLDAELPPVYGSSVWLTRALRELIANAARHASPKSRLEIVLRCTGTHVILSLRNHGHFANSGLLKKKLFVPFNRVEDYVREKKTVKTGAPGGPGLGLPICQQILHLHGGRMTVVEGEGDDIIEFNLELATGAPVQDTQVLDAQQAQRYAHDMVALMRRMQTAKKAPVVEK
ncbi:MULTISPECIES: sensor histidine kinase [unclassified Undibacterium]|uniref:sensor histidine kinase n=2 Tax=Undibacterium TaxID=401469 RepID=UPI002B227A96|nr:MULTISPECIES: sensor histidine kinase [unclassified Undibacterium]MEB0216278.1 sensor histidine kinase [Undibacterium sp. 5I2]